MPYNTRGPTSPVMPRSQTQGVRDLFAKRVLARESIIEKIRHVYELYGFEPLYTPALECLDVLVSGRAGQEAHDAIYRLANSGREEPLGLRFDLTVPLARVVAEMSDLPIPFRRYQVASVWRREKDTGMGRFCEFTQFDIDAVGVVAEVGDTEIIAAMCDTLRAVDAGPFVVRFSSRRILKALLDAAGASAGQVRGVFDVIDKVAEHGPENLRDALIDGYTDSTGEAIKGLVLKASQAELVETFLKVNAPHRADAIAQLRDLFADVGGAAAEIDALERISNHLYALGYGDDVVRFDPYVTRGLEYYTGTVFETTLLDAPEYGSVFSGGRYDDLLARSTGERFAGTGASLGVDRLIAALQKLKKFKTKGATTKVFVAIHDPTLMPEYLALTWELRRKEIPTELYLGTELFRDQLRSARRRGIPVALVYGRKEHASGVVGVKNMAAGQIEIPRAEVAQRVAAMLKEIDERERARGR